MNREGSSLPPLQYFEETNFIMRSPKWKRLEEKLKPPPIEYEKKPDFPPPPDPRTLEEIKLSKLNFKLQSKIAVMLSLSELKDTYQIYFDKLKSEPLALKYDIINHEKIPHPLDLELANLNSEIRLCQKELDDYQADAELIQYENPARISLAISELKKRIPELSSELDIIKQSAQNKFLLPAIKNPLTPLESEVKPLQAFKKDMPVKREVLPPVINPFFLKPGQVSQHKKPEPYIRPSYSRQSKKAHPVLPMIPENLPNFKASNPELPNIKPKAERRLSDPIFNRPPFSIFNTNSKNKKAQNNVKKDVALPKINC